VKARRRPRLWPDYRSWVADYRCGLHSGIPRCCLRFFVREWAPGIVIESDDRDALERDVLRTWRLLDGRDRACAAGGFPDAHYVMCPACVAAAARGERGPAVLMECESPPGGPHRGCRPTGRAAESERRRGRG
jgi:hypothetical protein